MRKPLRSWLFITIYRNIIDMRKCFLGSSFSTAGEIFGYYFHSKHESGHTTDVTFAIGHTSLLLSGWDYLLFVVGMTILVWKKYGLPFVFCKTALYYLLSVEQRMPYVNHFVCVVDTNTNNAIYKKTTLHFIQRFRLLLNCDSHFILPLAIKSDL